MVYFAMVNESILYHKEDNWGIILLVIWNTSMNELKYCMLCAFVIYIFKQFIQND